jgi:penicillin amidase
MAIERVIPLMKEPDAAYGATPAARSGARDQILLASLKDGIEALKRVVGPNFDQVKWGQIHTADFVHPLAHDEATRRLFSVQPVPRSGSAVTVLATSGATATDAKQQSGASFKFVFDTQDWDRSTGLSAPGQSAQPLSPHYADLAPLWGDGRHFPLVFSRAKVEENTKNRLRLEPTTNR